MSAIGDEAGLVGVSCIVRLNQGAPIEFLNRLARI